MGKNMGPQLIAASSASKASGSSAPSSPIDRSKEAIQQLSCGIYGAAGVLSAFKRWALIQRPMPLLQNESQE
jgi:hypothetical protein